MGVLLNIYVNYINYENYCRDFAEVFRIPYAIDGTVTPNSFYFRNKTVWY